MAIIGSASIQIHALDNLFKSEVESMVKQLKDQSIKIIADVDLEPVTAKIEALRKEIEDNPLNLKANVDVDDSTVAARMEELRARYSHEQINIQADVDTSPMDMAIEEATQRTRRSTINANADTGAAEAQLDFAARPRTSDFKINIDKEVLKGLQGFFYTLTGALPMPQIIEGLAGMAGNFEQLSFTAARWVTQIGVIGAESLSLGADLFVLGGDLNNFIGIAAAGPAAFSALGAVLATTHIAWNNFGNALSSNAKTSAKAMALLPPAAQAAAKEVKAMITDFTKPIQNAFWVEMGTSLQDTIKNVFPVLKAGLTDTSVALAKITSSVLDSFNAMTQSGGMKILLDNINQALGNMTPGIKAVVDALNILSVSGSKYLVTFGSYLSTLGEHFKDFIANAEATGKIDGWISGAVTTFKQLGSVAGSTLSILKGLTGAADLGGGKGLQSLVDGLQTIAKVVNAEPFQSKLIFVLNAARDGADALGKGFHTLMTAISDNAVILGHWLTVAGDVAGAFIGDISKILSGAGFQKGFLQFLAGMRSAAEQMEPTFTNIGDILGNLGQIAGTFFQVAAPGVNNLTGTISKVIANLTDGIKTVMPILNDMMQNLLQLFSGPFIQLSKILGDLLKGFASLPGPLQTLIFAFGTFMLLKGKFEDFGGSIQKTFGKIRDSFTKGFNPDASTSWDRYTQNMLDRALGVQTAVEGISTAAEETSTRAPSAFRAMSEDMSASVVGLGGKLKDFGAGIASGISNTLKDVAAPFHNVGSSFASDFKNGFMQGVGSLFKDIKIDTSTIQDNFKQVKAYGEYYLKSIPGFLSDGMNKAMSGISSGFSKLATEARPYTQALAGFVSDIGDKSIYMQKRFEDAGTAIKNAASDVSGGVKATLGSISDAATFAKTKVSDTVSSVLTSVEPITTKLSSIASTVGTKASEGIAAVKGVVSSIGDAIEPITSRLSSMGSTIASKISDGVGTVKNAVSDIGDAVSNAASKLPSNFEPAKAAFSSLSDAIGVATSTATEHLRGFATNAGASISNFTSTSMTKITTFGTNLANGIKSSMSSAASGLSSALGGPWAIAITAAITLMSTFANAQAQAKADTETYAATLNKVTGAMSSASMDDVTKKIIDQGSNFGDWIGRMGSDTVETTLDKMGVSIQSVDKRMADPTSRNAYVAGWKTIADTLRAGGNATQDMLDNVGLSDEAYTKASQGGLIHFSTKLSAANDMMNEAAKANKTLADANGITSQQAALLAQNFTTLEDATSSASDKFSALRENIDLLNKGQLTASDSTKNYYQQLDDTKGSLQKLTDGGKVLVGNLLDVKGGFIQTTQGGRDLQTALEGQRDAILKLGTDAMDQALKQGGSADDARAAALAKINPAIDDLRQSLKDMGVGKDQIDGVIQSLGLIPKNVETALHVGGADQAQAAIFRTSVMADAFKNGNYAAVLAALPDNAKQAIEDTTGMAGSFAKGDYTGILQALDKTYGGREQALLGIYDVVNRDYNAPIKAYADSLSFSTVAQQLRDLANQQRIAKIVVSYVHDGTTPGTAAGSMKIVDADGSVVDGKGRVLGGLAPGISFKAFANGGVENHVAQIAIPNSIPRIWAEPETGGEAYIPLGLNKRDRSTKILELVAKQFGFNLVKAFADGGSIGSTSASAIGGYSGPGINLNVYPSKGMNEKEIGMAAANELGWQIITRNVV